MANEGKLVTETVQIIREMETEITNAKKTLINSDTCIVNRQYLKEQLTALERNLPDALEQAAHIVETNETIRQEVEAQRKEILNQANAEATQKVNDAALQAQKMMESATNEANALAQRAQNDAYNCREAAKAEAARIIEDAQKRANQLVEEQTIVRRAKVESEEMLERAQNESTTLRKNTLDYIDSLLTDADRNMSELLNGIRLERSEIQSRR